MAMSVDDRCGGSGGGRTELCGEVTVALSLRKATLALPSPTVAPRFNTGFGHGGATEEVVEESVSGTKSAWSGGDAVGYAADCGTREGFTLLSRTGIGKVGVYGGTE